MLETGNNWIHTQHPLIDFSPDGSQEVRTGPVKQAHFMHKPGIKMNLLVQLSYDVFPVDFYTMLINASLRY